MDFSIEIQPLNPNGGPGNVFQQGSPRLWEAVIGRRRCECESSFRSFAQMCTFFIRVYGGGLIVGVLLAVGVIYHAIDMDLFAHVHGEDEREPASAEVGARLDPADTQKTVSFTPVIICMNIFKNHLHQNEFLGCRLSDLCPPV